MKTKARIKLFCVVALSSSGLTFAQTEVPHTFEAGQPARAAEVNENFTALETAVDDNATALAINEAAIQQNSAAIAELSSGDAIVLDFTDPDACVIDQSGLYVLDRNWTQIGSSGGNMACGAAGGAIIEINALNVILDLRGFTIGGDEFQGRFDPTVAVISGNATFRNGKVFGEDVAIEAFGSARVRLENMSASGSLLRDNSYVIDSRFSCGIDTQGLSVGANSVVLNSVLHCDSHGPPALYISGPYIEVRNNTFREGTIYMDGADFAVITGNVISTPRASSCFGIDAGRSDNSILARNTITHKGLGTCSGILIEGTGNVVDANIMTQLATGIDFRQTGNFYGNNRVSAMTPFSGTAGQTDWGGNVSY